MPTRNDVVRTTLTAVLFLLSLASITTADESGDRMTKDEFWEIIAQSRRADCEQQAEALRDTLAKMSQDRIASFDRRWRELMADSYRWDLWAIAYIVNGGCSDDGFEYFRAWLIGQGRAYYEAAMQEAEHAANSVKRGDEVECESLMYAAAEAYESVSGKQLPPTDVKYPAAPVGDEWEEDDLPQRYPSLSKRFS